MIIIYVNYVIVNKIEIRKDKPESGHNISCKNAAIIAKPFKPWYNIGNKCTGGAQNGNTT